MALNQLQHDNTTAKPATTPPSTHRKNQNSPYTTVKKSFITENMLITTAEDLISMINRIRPDTNGSNLLFNLINKCSAHHYTQLWNSFPMLKIEMDKALNFIKGSPQKQAENLINRSSYSHLKTCYEIFSWLVTLHDNTTTNPNSKT